MVSLLRQSDINNVDKVMTKKEMYDAWLASEDRKDKQSAKDDFIAIYGDSPIYYAIIKTNMIFIFSFSY